MSRDDTYLVGFADYAIEVVSKNTRGIKRKDGKQGKVVKGEELFDLLALWRRWLTEDSRNRK